MEKMEKTIIIKVKRIPDGYRGVSFAGDIREFILPIDDEFWSAAEESRNQAVISTAIANCGGKENLDSIFSRLEKKIRG